jgi:hypothetical protein
MKGAVDANAAAAGVVPVHYAIAAAAVVLVLYHIANVQNGSRKYSK